MLNPFVDVLDLELLLEFSFELVIIFWLVLEEAGNLSVSFSLFLSLSILLPRSLFLFPPPDGSTSLVIDTTRPEVEELIAEPPRP